MSESEWEYPTPEYRSADVEQVGDQAQIVPLSGNKEYHAYQLHLQGMSWPEIAEKVDYANGPTARVQVRAYLTRAAGEMEVARKAEILETEMARLDALQSAAWPDAMLGDVKSIGAVLAVMKHRATLLGLGEGNLADATKYTTVVIAGSEEEYIRALEAQGKQTAGAVDE